MDAPKTNEKKIYVSNIPKHVDSKMLQRYFENFGSVYSAVVIVAKKGKSLSYGFVSFSSRKSLEKVLATKQHILEGCVLAIDTVSVEKAKSNLVKYAGGEDSNVFLFVQDIPKDVNRQVLVEHFLKFGDLTKARLVSRPDKNKDFVYLQYKSIDAAANAKSQKHKINGLSKESITLVCKVGIFRNQKQIQVMEDAEDLLRPEHPSRKQTIFTTPTGLTDEEFLRQTEVSRLPGFTDIMELDDEEYGCYFGEDEGSMKPRNSENQDGLASRIVPQEHSHQGAFQLESFPEISSDEEICLLSYCLRIKIATLDETVENYRFNQAKPHAQQEAQAEAEVEYEENEDPQFGGGRQRAVRHLTVTDLTGMGAIGTGRKSIVPKSPETPVGTPPQQSGSVPANNSGVFKSVLKSILPTFKLRLWK